MAPTSGKDLTVEEDMQYYLNLPVPPNATKEYEKLFLKLQKLLGLLTFHDAMKPNLKQTRPTAHSRVFHMWDFTFKSFRQLVEIDPTLPASQGKRWKDVVDRSVMADMLIRDEDKLDMVLGSKEDFEDGIEFGDEIVRVSQGAAA